MGWGREIYCTVQYISLIKEGEGEGMMTMMTMRRFLLKREVAAISDWEFGKNKRKRKKGVWLCIVEAPCWMDV